MNLRSGQSLIAALALPIALLVSTGCGGSTAGVVNNGITPNALSTALSSSTETAGTLVCAPAQAQVDACATLAAGAACTLTAPDGTTTIAGTCRTTIDGTSVACAPKPPAPPAELVTACASLSAGAPCTVTEALGDTHAGVCVNARDGATLICGRAHTPPQASIDACTTAAAGDACTWTNMMGGTMSGVCSYGPAGTGFLACTRRQDVLPNGQNACTGLAVGAGCKMGRHQEMSGVCTTPAAGGEAVCMVACASAGGEFNCRGPGPGPGGMMGGMTGPTGGTGPVIGMMDGGGGGMMGGHH